MTPAMNYKQATGVRARSDLTANRLPTRMGALTDTELVTVAEHLGKHASENRPLTLNPKMCGRLADALLECVNRVGEV
jgi:hypothetical protein